MAPKGAQIWPFDRNLKSLSDIEPAAGFVATLVPEGKFDGAVAVVEGTENLVTDQSFWSARTGAMVTRELVTSGQWAGWYKVHATKTGTGIRGYIGSLQPYPMPNGSTHTLSIDFYSETGKIKPRFDG